jgi:hypothetical protein
MCRLINIPAFKIIAAVSAQAVHVDFTISAAQATLTAVADSTGASDIGQLPADPDKVL